MYMYVCLVYCLVNRFGKYFGHVLIRTITNMPLFTNSIKGIERHPIQRQILESAIKVL